MKAKLLSFTTLLTFSTALSACGDINGVPAEYSEARSGSIHAYTGLRSDSTADVVSIRYTVKACDGSGSEISAVIPLQPDMVLPGGLGSFQDSPLDKDSAHRFADFFQVLDAGCYDVTAQPINADELPSEKCSSAEAKGLNVMEGATTEAVLIVQCQEPDPGALDVVTVVNHEPRITNIVFKKKTEDGKLVDGSKFVCGLENHICVVAHDPDRDPLSFELKASVDGLEEVCQVTEVDSSPWTIQHHEKCYLVKCLEPGKIDLHATVFDMVKDQNKQLITFEDYFKSINQPKTSRAQVSFMTYLGGDEACEDPCPPEEKDPKKPGKHGDHGHGHGHGHG